MMLDDVRGDLERRPQHGGRDPFAVDEDRALDALRWLWGDAYTVTVAAGEWQATRRDGLGGTITASLPGGLNRAMREDWSLKPVVVPR